MGSKLILAVTVSPPSSSFLTGPPWSSRRLNRRATSGPGQHPKVPRYDACIFDYRSPWSYVRNDSGDKLIIVDHRRSHPARRNFENSPGGHLSTHQRSPAQAGLTVSGARKALEGRFGSARIARLIDRGVLKIVQSKSDLPRYLQDSEGGSRVSMPRITTLTMIMCTWSQITFRVVMQGLLHYTRSASIMVSSGCWASTSTIRSSIRSGEP